MIEKLNIGVIGSGAAGAASAIFLSRQGHQVTVFEKVKEPKPIGSGVMLQPSGLEILFKLGVGDDISKAGTKITQFVGETPSGKSVLDIDFKKVDQGFYGLGISRGAIFSLLHQQLSKEDVTVLGDNEIVKIEKNSSGKYVLLNSYGQHYKEYDLVIVANGAKSKLREKYPVCKKSKKQRWAAVWAKVPYDNTAFNHSIVQYYKGTQKMLGFMPIGTLPYENTQQEYVNVFWSVKGNQKQLLENKKWDELKDEMLSVSNGYKDVLNQISSIDEFVFAPYFDAEVRPMYYENIVFIGDSAHAMSPQLSQGTGFALLDAYELSEAIRTSSSLPKALKRFSKSRLNQTKYFQFVSRIVTPLFQSNLKITWFRNFIFPIATKIPFLRNLFVFTVLGYRKTIFTNLDRSYKLRK